MAPFARFLLFESVGWALGAVILAWLAREEYVSTGLAVALFALLVLKDLVLYPLTRKAYEQGHPHGASELLGAEVRVETALDPDGWVRAGAERWRARVAGDVADGMLEAGSRARVLALRGLTLIVEPIESSPS